MTDDIRPARISDAVFTVDAHWRISSFSPGAEALFGISAAEVVGRDCHEVVEATHFSGLCTIKENLAAGRAVKDYRMVVPGPDGGQRVITVSAMPVPDVDGLMSGAVVVLSDVTDEAGASPYQLDSIADGVFTVDRDWRITSFNRAAEEITGWKREDALGRPCQEVFRSSVCGDACILGQVLREGKASVNRAIFIHRADGRSLPVSISAAPLLDQEGRVIGGVETFRDITSLLEKNLILDSVADGVFTVNRQWRITSFNRAAEEITGWKREDALGRPCREVFRSSVCGDACILGQAVTHGRPVINRTIFMKRIDGRNVPVSISAAPLVDHAGRVIGGVETFRDVTASLERDLILDSVADGVFTVDEDWRITSFNRAAEKITGWKREEAVGRPCREIFHSSICGEACAIAQCMVTGAPTVERPITIQRKDGKALSVSISAAPLTDHEGNVIGGVETFRDLSLLTSLRKQLARRYTFGDIISKSPAMQRIFDILPEIARSDSNVLITGESGTGKELIAQAIHDLSERRKGPFVAVNCGALPDTLLESELFGYKAGAFTDAKHDRPGRLAAAEKGTLFLDEIGDISPAIQVKLLRVLQTRMYEPLGSNRPVKADVRILAATNRDLQALVAEERFREDLYYRLNVARVHLPPLRERIEDVPLLVNHFIEKFNAQKGKAVAGISDEALRALMHYDFPGNIRELENIIEYAFILCHGGFIELEHLPEPFSGTGGEVPAGLDLDQALSLEEIEKRAIYQALKRNRWKRLATCRELGISKDTLRRKIQKYRLEVPED